MSDLSIPCIAGAGTFALAMLLFQRSSKAVALTLGLLVLGSAHAQFTVTEGRGYTLCERLAAHVNRLTENGKAKRFWTFHGRDLSVNPHIPIRYPGSQSYLTREVLSFPGFKRPNFSEIALVEIRGLVELMGEVDALGIPSFPHYKNDEVDVARYVVDRMAGRVHDELVEKLRPQGQRLYERLVKGKARVFKLTGGDAPTSQTLLQIEYEDEANGEPVALLRHVSSDLTEPLPRGQSFDWSSPSKVLVKWKNAYYTVYASAGEFEATNVSGSNPYICRVGNAYTPATNKPSLSRN